MNQASATYELLPRLSIQRYLDQRFGEEYRIMEPSASSPPSPPLPPHPFGSVGDERLQRGRREEGPVAVQVRQAVIEAAGPLQQALQRHHHREMPPAPAPPAQPPQPPGPAIFLIRPPNLIENRPMCCSFCFGTATHWAIEMGLVLPEKDDWGVWSTHPCKERGIVTCPFLWQVTCPLCGATGANAHTRTEHIRMGWR